ncbi:MULTISPECIES: malonic semialdehyde reductase [Iodidimonas]|uniref:Putative NADH dehydrogenase/NAD(P)H nitroreductase JCM17846_02300 n=1 Tax=Iodidimonas nitroreducens TaxID=1236968 RepID=A0A5A7N366_9PROT|nr:MULTISPECIES: malonic semialdehyde reductase [Iodidimonas]GAK34747.1 putative NADH dehydrogenase/NAD(P)H nitroreductase [alpha proteobacterium Q-1]GER02548.1 putative NADH dehydrogenase/NAD(P)H nitroreductase [Iodidimonas nitroreducens]
MSATLSDAALDTLFRTARSYNRWQAKSVSDETVGALYDLLKYGPTSANCSPARFVFVKSQEAKARLMEHVIVGNRVKVEQAPLIVIIAWDRQFYDKIPQLFPHNPDARNWFAHDAEVAQSTAFRNATLQGAYLMLAARALGLDCGPMSGFDQAGLDADFFPDGQWVSNFICALGHGSEEELYPRSPRLAFDEACRIL